MLTCSFFLDYSMISTIILKNTYIYIHIYILFHPKEDYILSAVTQGRLAGRPRSCSAARRGRTRSPGLSMGISKNRV